MENIGVMEFMYGLWRNMNDDTTYQKDIYVKCVEKAPNQIDLILESNES